MKPSPLQRLALRLQPEINEYRGVQRASGLLNVYNIIFTTPLAVFALVWLALETKPELIRTNGLTFFVLFVIAFIVNFNYFEIQIELRPGVFATSSGTMMFIVAISALFIFGPTAYWLSVVVTLIIFILQYFRDSNRTARWNRLSTLTSSISNGILAILVGFWVYERMGGTYPLGSLTAETVWPAIVFLLIDWLLPFLVMSPLLLYITRTPDFVGEEGLSGSSLIPTLFVNASLPNLALPFTILGAALYTLNGAFIYFFFLAGILLTSYLASGLTKNANDRAQRARELGILEQISRQIIMAPPDASTLAHILKEQIPAMFFRGRTMIWLEPDKILYASEEARFPDLNRVRNHLPMREDSNPYQLIPPQTLVEDRLRDSIVLPIQNDDGKRLGGLYFEINRDVAKIREFIPALQSLAAQIASALYRAEAHKEALLKARMANELELAGRIQANFLPEEIPTLPGYEIAASLTPALQTSGDFYDFIVLPDGRLGILIADVADKGTGAALFMALTRTLIRTYALEYPHDPALVFKLTNDRVHQDTQSQLFITTFYGIIHPQQHTLAYVNGGHNPPYLFRTSDSQVDSLNRTGIPIGMFEDAQWTCETVPFHPGDLLVLYTDGVTEAQNMAEEFFEDSRLLEVGASSLGCSAVEAHHAILKAVRSFVGNAPQFDDVTLLAIRRTG